jgi:hypothetical protein
MDSSSTKPIVYSIFINNVKHTRTKEEILRELNQMELGKVEDVQMIEKSISSRRGKINFWQVTVYYSSWNEANSYALKLRNDLGGGINFIHSYNKNAADGPEEWCLERFKPIKPPITAVDIASYDHSPCGKIKNHKKS